MSDARIWLVIVLLSIGTYLMRWSFLGVFGRRQLPDWAQRHLRFTTVAVLPALIAPGVIWPPATGGEPDPARLLAAAATVAVGMATRSILIAIAGGMATLYLALWLIG